MDRESDKDESPRRENDSPHEDLVNSIERDGRLETSRNAYLFHARQLADFENAMNRQHADKVKNGTLDFRDLTTVEQERYRSITNELNISREKLKADLATTSPDEVWKLDAALDALERKGIVKHVTIKETPPPRKPLLPGLPPELPSDESRTTERTTMTRIPSAIEIEKLLENRAYKVPKEENAFDQAANVAPKLVAVVPPKPKGQLDL